MQCLGRGNQLFSVVAAPWAFCERPPQILSVLDYRTGWLLATWYIIDQVGEGAATGVRGDQHGLSMHLDAVQSSRNSLKNRWRSTCLRRRPEMPQSSAPIIEHAYGRARAGHTQYFSMSSGICRDTSVYAERQ